MKRTLLPAAAILIYAAMTLPAQEAANDANPLLRAMTLSMHTISVPPIPGAPFSATAVIKNQQKLPDGSVQVSSNINLIGRDSRGRTHGEMRSRVLDSYKGLPPLSEVHLYDPQTRTLTVYYPRTRIATTRTFAEQPGTASANREAGSARAPDPGLSSAGGVNLPAHGGASHATATSGAQTYAPVVKVEDLGMTTLDGLDARGTRRTVVLAAADTGTPITVVDEYWYSEDLHVNLVFTHNDPRTGYQTIALTDLVRGEPDSTFFEVPSGYKVVDLTPPSGAVTGQAVAMPDR